MIRLPPIKLVRARTGVNLKVAKDQVELVMEARGIAKPGKRGCIFVVVFAIVALFGIVLVFIVSASR